MLPRLVFRTLRNANKRCLWKFTWNFGVKGLLSVEKFKRRIKRGEYFPPFLYLSINSACNLRCQGCWVDVEARNFIDLQALNRLISDAKRHGNSFFGILGGEPFKIPKNEFPCRLASEIKRFKAWRSIKLRASTSTQHPWHRRLQALLMDK